MIFVYPGSFDPVTNGHLNIIDRASKLCNKLIVAVLVNSSKTSTFTIEERVDFLKRSLCDRPGVLVESFSGLLADYVVEKKADAIIKGLRSTSDFEYEIRMALLNKNLNSQIETLFMAADVELSHVNSSIVREIARYSGKIDNFVPECIKNDILMRLKQ